jgi:hypothetical protein
MKTTYTYTVLRYVHDTTTGEFANVGVALFAPEARYASAICRTTYGRLGKVFPGINGESFKSLMRFIQSRFEEMGTNLREELPLEEVPKSVMPLAHSVLPADDSALQWSEPGGGITEDPSATLEAVYARMVTRYDEAPQYERRSDDEVWRKFKRGLETRHVLRYLQPKKIAVQDDEVEFDYAWKNQQWHCLEPLSFDLTAAESIREKAHRWLGQITSVKDAKDRFKVYLLLGEPQLDKLKPAFDNALSILNKIPVEKELIREREATRFSEQFSDEVEAHEKPVKRA